MTDLDNWITTSQACELSGYHPDYVRKLLQTGKINGQKWGFAWMVDRTSLLAYLAQAGTKGERRGPKRKSID